MSKKAGASKGIRGAGQGRFRRSGLRVLLVLAALIVAATAESSGAADLTARLRGGVSQPGGGALRGAAVALTGRDTGVVLRTHTRRDGGYGFPQVPAGQYSLTVQMPGFQTFTVYGIELGNRDERGGGGEFVRNFEMMPGSMTRAVMAEAVGGDAKAAPEGGSSR